MYLKGGSMDDIDPTLNQEVVEPTQEAPSADETKPTEEVETTEPETTVEGTEESTETVETPKKGAQSRIRELNAKAKSAEEKAHSLEQKLAELTGMGVETPNSAYVPKFEGSEIDPEVYRQEVVKSAVSAAQLVAKQSEAVNRINNEATQIIRQYPQLDPDSDQFDKELSDSVTEATIAHVQSSPYSASPKKFVERMMKPFTRAVTKEVGKATENIAKQVSQAATRPTSVSTAGGKSNQDKSIKELEAELGIVQS